MKKRRFPSGPNSIVPFKLFMKFKANPLHFLENMAKTYGDVSYMRLGLQHIYLINDPELIKDVLVTRDSKFSKGRTLGRAKVLLGNGLITSGGEFHKRQRRLVTPAFHRLQIARYAEIMVQSADQVSRTWKNTQTLDIWEEMMQLTMVIICKTMFGFNVEADAKEVGQAFTDILDKFDIVNMPYDNLVNKLPLPSVRRFKKARDRLDLLIFQMIEERRNKPETGEDLLSMLLSAQDSEDDGKKMTDVQVRDEAMTLFLAGHETMANGLTWTWYLLSKNPHVAEKLMTELHTVLNGRLPTIDDVPLLVYTEKVLSESMRLLPPVWLLGRRVVEDIELGGFHVPKQSIVLMSQYIAHRDERFWPDAEMFDPERWTPEAKGLRPLYSYFPFGGGSRKCIAQGFAVMEGVLLIATLAQRWKMDVSPDFPLQLSPQITLRPQFGLPVTMEKRQ